MLQISPPASSRAHAVLASALFVILVVAAMLALLPKAPAQAAPAGQSKPAATALKIFTAPNPHFSPRAARKVDTLVVHFASGINVNPAHWDDPKLVQRIFTDHRVSAHYLIDRTGTVYRLVDENNIAWQAGGSIMPAPDNRRNVNAFSIGIELIATRTSGFTEAQYTTLARLVKELQSRHPIRHIVGHDEIAGRRAVRLGLRRDVKPDPGPRFDWSRVPGRLS